jgi:hypothetical protein
LFCELKPLEEFQNPRERENGRKREKGCKQWPQKIQMEYLGHLTIIIQKELLGPSIKGQINIFISTDQR